MQARDKVIPINARRKYRGFNDVVYISLDYLSNEGPVRKSWVRFHARLEGKTWLKISGFMTSNNLASINADGLMSITEKGTLYYRKMRDAKQILDPSE